MMEVNNELVLAVYHRERALEPVSTQWHRKHPSVMEIELSLPACSLMVVLTELSLFGVHTLVVFLCLWFCMSV
jgi:hypothetical protein